MHVHGGGSPSIHNPHFPADAEVKNHVRQLERLRDEDRLVDGQIVSLAKKIHVRMLEIEDEIEEDERQLATITAYIDSMQDVPLGLYLTPLDRRRQASA